MQVNIKMTHFSLYPKTAALIKKMQLLFLWIILTCCITRCSSFSAQLTRPWEIESSAGNSKSITEQRKGSPVRRRRRGGGRLWRLIWEDADVLIILASSSNDDDTKEPVNNSIDGGYSESEIVERNIIESSDDETLSNFSSLITEARTSAVNSSPYLVSKQNPTQDYLEHISHTSSTTVWKSRGSLFQMTRPANIPGVILFHMLGVYLVLEATGQSANYWSILLKEPVVWLTLLATNIVSATSMLVNDYYDAKLGRDALKSDSKLLLLKDSPLSQPVVKLFLMYMYAAALVVSNFLPGIPTRLSVTVALIMTYLYTVHLKPMTWVKNVVCASLIALAPWTSGSCVLYLLKYTGNISIWFVPSLWRLFGVLFCGVVSREILMDCTDLPADAASGIRTIPVVHGRFFAAKVAAVSTLIMTVLATGPHLRQLLQLPSVVPLWSATPLRRLILAATGSAFQLKGTLQAWHTKGADNAVIDKMIGQSLLSVVFLLASFV